MISLSRQLVDAGDDVFYDPGFRRMIEVHVNMLKNHPDTTQHVIAPHLVYQYEGDFFGLLGHPDIGVAFAYRWVYLRVNGYRANHEFGQHLEDPYTKTNEVTLFFPPEATIEELATRYQTRS